MDMVLDDPINYVDKFLLHRREWSATDLGTLETWDCVPATELFSEDEPDLDKFFEN